MVFRGFYLPAEVHQGGWHEFAVTSTHRLPSPLFYANEPGDSFVWFSLGGDRVLSSRNLFSPPFRVSRRKRVWMVEWDKAGRFELPRIHGLDSGSWTLGLKLSSLHATDEQVMAQYGDGEAIWGAFPFTLQ